MAESVSGGVGSLGTYSKEPIVKSAPKFHLPTAKCERVVVPKDKFDPKSFRWIQTVRGAVLIGCPKGSWSGSSCKVGTMAHSIVLRARANGTCKAAYKRA